ncbi:MAG: hypothetical protein AAGC85_06820 [Bacteroidota bacterium]
MKNKKLNIILLPVVGAIWILLLFRILGTKTNPAPVPKTLIDTLNDPQLAVIFELKEGYRDPFLDHPTSERQEVFDGNRKVKSHQVGRMLKKEEEEVLHKCNYHGAISSQSNPTDLTGILSIDGEMHILGPDTSSPDIVVLEISMNHIRIKVDQKEYEVTKE